MNIYSKALFFLNSLLNLEQAAGAPPGIWNLRRMRRLLERFHYPERGVFTVLVAGTKGKGSTAYFLSEILRRSGLGVGLYHSPHLENPTERIWINGKPISRREFAEGLLKIEKAIRPQTGFTYFEVMTLLAALLFKERGVEIAVYEVGMGGRLDATNALPARLTLLTPIHYDHEAWLGRTLKKIAREKAAILRRRRDVVTAWQPPEVLREIQKAARKKKCPVWRPVPDAVLPPRLGLLGDFQRLNARVALRAARILRDRYGFPVSREAMYRGVSSNHWPGRMELFKAGARRAAPLLLDGAHNPKSVIALVRNVKTLFPRKRKILIFGTSRDKRTDRMLPVLGKTFDVGILTQSQSSRAKETAALLHEARNHFPVLLAASSSGRALALARRLARPQDLIVGTGSFYLIGELRKKCRT